MIYGGGALRVIETAAASWRNPEGCFGGGGGGGGNEGDTQVFPSLSAMLAGAPGGR